MRLFSFDASSGRPLTRWIDAKGVPHRVDPKTSKVVISPILSGDAAARIACFHVGVGGFIPRHPATIPQLFAVLDGRGWVAGADGRRVPIQTGQAAFWEGGESHESGSDEGMRVIVFEGPDLDPSQHMREVRF